MGYLGQPHPGLAPEVFAPGIVSLDNQAEFNITFTPDGREIYFTAGTRTETNVMVARLENGHWTEPELAPFSREYANWSPFITGDGQNLFFVSDRPLDGSSRRSDPNIWMVERTEGTWTEPQCLDEPVRSFDAEYTPFVASDGTL